MDKGKDDVSLLALSNMGAVCYNSITLYCSIHFRIYMHLHVILYATDQFRLCSFCMLLMSRAISSESSESSTSRASARGFESSEDLCSNSSLERRPLLELEPRAGGSARLARGCISQQDCSLDSLELDSRLCSTSLLDSKPTLLSEISIKTLYGGIWTGLWPRDFTMKNW